jgi:hypothetical protein
MSRIERPLYGRFKKRGKIFNKFTCFGENLTEYESKSQKNTAYTKNYTSKHFQIGEFTDCEKLIVNNRRILMESGDNIDYNDYFYSLMPLHNNYVSIRTL